jgi:hypothetical protein
MLKSLLRLRFAFILVVLISVTLACQIPLRGFSLPTATPIPVSTQAVEQLIQNAGAAAATAASGGQVQLVVTEEQLTSLAVIGLQSQQEFMVKDLQIRLRDSLIQISGQVLRNNIRLPVHISLSASTDAQGKPHFQIMSAGIGRFPLPQEMLDQLSTQLDTMLAGQLQSLTPGLFIQQIAISEGYLTISGYKQ